MNRAQRIAVPLLSLAFCVVGSGCGRHDESSVTREPLARAAAAPSAVATPAGGVKPARAESTAKLGATNVLNPSAGDALKAILDLTHGMGADLAFEAVGVTTTVDLSLRCLRKGGSATLIGNVTPKTEFPLQTAVTRELTLYGSCASQGEYPACVDMLARGALKAAPLISATAPLAEGAGWFERLYRKEPGLLKVVLVP